MTGSGFTKYILNPGCFCLAKMRIRNPAEAMNDSFSTCRTSCAGFPPSTRSTVSRTAGAVLLSNSPASAIHAVFASTADWMSNAIMLSPLSGPSARDQNHDGSSADNHLRGSNLRTTLAVKDIIGRRHGRVDSDPPVHAFRHFERQSLPVPVDCHINGVVRWRGVHAAKQESQASAATSEIRLA